MRKTLRLSAITPDRFWLLFVDATRKAPAAAPLTDAEAVAMMKSHAWCVRATCSGAKLFMTRSPKTLTKRQDVKPPGIRGRGGMIGIPLTRGSVPPLARAEDNPPDRQCC